MRKIESKNPEINLKEKNPVLSSTLYFFIANLASDLPLIQDEITILSRNFKTIYLIPFKNTQVNHSFPQNVVVCFPVQGKSHSSVRLVLNNFFLFFRILLDEFIISESKVRWLNFFRFTKSNLLSCFSAAGKLMLFLKSKPSENRVFYTFWFDEWATVLAILKSYKKITHFFSRGHGYDIYAEQWNMNFIPFRTFQLKTVDSVFTDSAAGCKYLSHRYPPYASKLSVRYLGSFDRGTNPFPNESTFTILSCSCLVPVKRVPFIAEALHYCDFPVHWIHIGDGTMKQELSEKASELPPHIKKTFTGYISDEEKFKIFSSHPINLFLHVSASEGLPLAAVEAASFGIPMMACHVGGLGEIISDETGILLPPSITPYEIASEINAFMKSEKNTPGIREKVKSAWTNKFNAEKNYNDFCQFLLYS